MLSACRLRIHASAGHTQVLVAYNSYRRLFRNDARNSAAADQAPSPSLLLPTTSAKAIQRSANHERTEDKPSKNAVKETGRSLVSGWRKGIDRRRAPGLRRDAKGTTAKSERFRPAGWRAAKKEQSEEAGSSSRPIDPFAVFLGEQSNGTRRRCGGIKTTFLFASTSSKSASACSNNDELSTKSFAQAPPTTTRSLLRRVLRQAVASASATSPLEARRDLERTWPDAYVCFLSRSHDAEDFARRFGTILRRLPRSQVSPLISRHNSPRFAQLVSTASLNQILAYAYKDVGDFALARTVVRRISRRRLPRDAETYQIMLGAYVRAEDWNGVASIRRAMEAEGLAMTPFAWSRVLALSRGLAASAPPELALPSLSAADKSQPTPITLESFLRGWRWGPAHPATLVTVVSKLIEQDRWKDAEYLVHVTLEQRGPKPDIAFDSRWALTILRTLVKGAPSRILGRSLRQYVQDFRRRHHAWAIPVDAPLFLSCLRHNLDPPSEVVSTLRSWTVSLGLDPAALGSRTATRILRSMDIYIRRASADGLPDTAITEARVMRNWWLEPSAIGGLRMLGRGPRDGRMVRGKYSFWAAQDIAVIRGALRNARQTLRRCGAETAGMTLDNIDWDKDLVHEVDGQGLGLGNLRRVYSWDSERRGAADIRLSWHA